MTGPQDLYRYRAILIPWVPAKPWRGIPASDYSWHDGDTFTADVDRGGRDHWHVRVRCAGYDAPETNGPSRPRGDAATAYVRALVPMGSVVYLNSLAFEPSEESDNFGRMLAEVTLPDGRDLAQLMIVAGMIA